MATAKKRNLAPAFTLLAVALLAFDQWSKHWTVTHLELGESAPFLPGFVELLRLHNYGAAWSSFSGMRWLLIGVTGALMIVLLVCLIRGIVRHPLGCFSLSLVLSGGIGNLIDRVMLGYVVDMLHLEFWPSYPVFNVADMCVVVGVVLLMLYYFFFYEQYDSKAARKKKEEAQV